jgi:hypothetical protein
MTELTLTQRVQRLEDIEAIKDVTARYATAVSKGWNGKTLDLEAIPSIFTTDVHWESKSMGITADGVDAIVADLPESTAMVQLSMHSFVNPVITIDADTAAGNWLMCIAAIIGDDPRAVYLSADMTYARTGDGWRIRSVDIHYGMFLSAKTLASKPIS